MSGAACRAVFLLAVVLAGSAAMGGFAFAHVTADDMPDSMAKMEYKIYLEFKPDDTLVRNKLGMVYYRLNKPEKAEREFARILEQAPDNYDALDGMGLVKAAAGAYDAAVNYHRQALAVNGEDMTIYYHLGQALEKKGLPAEAADAYRTALQKYKAQALPADSKAKAEFADKVRAAVNRVETRRKKGAQM